MDLIDPESCNELNSAERPNFFSGQLLTPIDLKEEQSYHREKIKQHNRYLHGSGVVCGLWVVPADPEKQRSVVVKPGLALDSWGREIVVPEPIEFELGCHTDSVYVVLEYRECPTNSVPVFNEPVNDSEERTIPTRISETYQLTLRRKPPEVSDNISQQLCELLIKALRQKMGAAKLHALLCEIVSQPCQPCGPDPAVTLARIDLPVRNPITTGDIDNCSHRHLALSTDRVFQILLCSLGKFVRQKKGRIKLKR
jgi:hypothetical protein